MPSRSQQLRIALAGGGSGGHIYPNLAVLEALEHELGSDAVSARFLVSERPIDRSILEGEQRAFSVIAARPVRLRPLALLRLIFGWGGAVRAARAAIRDHDAQIVLATGGFVSAPVMIAARAERVPLVLLNLDAVAGKANRFVGRKAAIRLTSATGPGVPPDWEAVRPVVRASATPTQDARQCRDLLGLEPDRRTLLVTGGSQGARSINNLLAHLASHHPEAFADWQILHQCGENETARLETAYREAGVLAHCHEYLSDMAAAWGAADLAVARCGAGTVAELWSNQIPSVLLPYPYHRDQHQAANAKPLADAGAAFVETDQIDPERNASTAGQHILKLLADDSLRQTVRSAFDRLGPTDGASTVARQILQLIAATE